MLSNKVIQINPNNIKALYRRALGYWSKIEKVELGEDLKELERMNEEIEVARKDLEKILFIDA